LGSKDISLIVVFFVTLLMSSYFASCETAISMANIIRLTNLKEHGDKKASRALYLADEASAKMLITILILTNIAHIVCASMATLFVTRMWGISYVSISTIVTTIIMFIFGETIPKNYAASDPDRVAMNNSFMLLLLVNIMAPICTIFSFIEKILSKLVKDDEEPTVNEEELYDIIDNVAEAGAIDEEQSELIQCAIEFDDTTIQDILVPRPDIAAVDIESTPDEIISQIKKTRFSRLPVYQDSIDNIVGIINIKDYIKLYLVNKEETKIAECMMKPFFIYKSKPVDEALSEMSSKRTHMAIVNDEYGGTLGLVTVEDMLEELVGEIWDEEDIVEMPFEKLDDRSYKVDADMLVTDLFDEIEFEDYDEDDFEHKTVGAWAIEEFDRMPNVNEAFNYRGMNFKVSKATNTRIGEFIVTIDTVKDEEASE